MEQNQMYVEIELKDLIYAVLKSWRMLIVVGIIFAVLLGTYKGIPNFHAVNDGEVLASNKEEYEKKLQKYEADLNQLSRIIDNLNNEIASKEEYLENSVLMQINPYDEIISTIDYYISSETYNFSILNYYVNFAESELYNEVLNKAGLDMDLKYLKEILTVNVDYNSDMLSITLKHWDNELSKSIMNSIKEAFETKEIEIRNAIGDHVCKLVNESNVQTIDLDLENEKKNLRNTIDQLRLNLENKEAALKALSKPERSVITYGTAIKNTFKYIIIGGILGIFLEAGCLLFTYLISGKLKDKNVLRKCFQLKLLGDFSKAKEGKIFGFIDRWISKVFGYKNNNIPEDEVIQIINSNLSLLLHNERKEQKILLTGSIEENELQQVSNKLINKMKNSNFDITFSPNINASATTIKKAAETDGVILVEKYNGSMTSEIERELVALNHIGARVIGIILI